MVYRLIAKTNTVLYLNFAILSKSTHKIFAHEHPNFLNTDCIDRIYYLTTTAKKDESCDKKPTFFVPKGSHSFVLRSKACMKYACSE